MRKLTLSALICVFGCTVLAQQSHSLLGEWEGAIEIQGNNLPIKTHFTNGDSISGSIDIQGTTLPLQNIHFGSSDSAFFEFVTSVNVARFKGQFTADTIITGQYHQAGQQFSFELIKKEIRSADRSLKQKPNYNQEELIIQNDSIKIGGTLTWPEDEPADKLVIMISGSGAQDRDETMRPLSDFKPFALLADSLTTGGIATFRYDDRGVGQSSGNFGNAKLQMLASDVEAIINELTTMPDHDFKEIILLGHSQGGVVGGKVAAQNAQVDKLILMASTGVPLKEILRFQVKQVFASTSIDSALVAQEINARGQLMDAIRDQKGIETAKENYQKQFAAVQMAAGVDSSQALSMAKNQAQQLVNSLSSPQMKSLLFYDPAEDLRQLDIPVLVLFGGKDMQVTADMNKQPIQNALETAEVPYQIEIFEHANHPFQKANTGSYQEYATLKKEFIDNFTSTIATWIKKEGYSK